VGGAPIETSDDPVEASFCHLVTGVVKGKRIVLSPEFIHISDSIILLAKFRQLST